MVPEELKEYKRQHYLANKARYQKLARQNYQDNKDAYKKKAFDWKRDHPERFADLQRNWRRTEKGKEQSRNWTADNKEAHYTRTKDWKSRNPDKVAEYTGTRRAAQLQATPPWLTPEHRNEIRVFYTDAKRRQNETGQKHHVDHIIPLQSEIVCGLHVPWNLQVLSESENAAKGNRFEN